MSTPYTDSAPIPHHIAGRRLELGPVTPVHNPATGQVARWVHEAEGPQIVQAVASAKAAQPAWGAMPAQQRARVLMRFLQQAQSQRELLASMITAEHGKTFDDALGEVQRGLDIVEYACGAPNLLMGQHSAQAATGLDHWTIPQPLGITVGVTPFNFPFMVPMWMAPMALACGNAFILKPSPLDPSPGIWMAEALLAAGLPPGVFQVLHGGAEVVNGLLHHPDVAALSFVGSTAVARDLYAKGGSLGKRVQALGGAKNHLVVMPDADMDAAVEALVGAAYGSAGERCMAISVAVLVGKAPEVLLPKLTERVRALRMGAGHQDGVEMGPVISAAAKARIEDLIDSGEKDGAKLLVDGRGRQVAGHLNGFFLGGTLFDQVQPWMRIYQEEIFGPVLVCLHVPDLGAALELIHSHPYANGVSLFTRDGGAAREFTQAVQVGMVGINVPIPVPMAWMGFGGWKASLFGELHAYGPDAVRFYTRRKAVMQRWGAAPSGSAFSMPVAR
jgi:malonate-semialdehyde dehydrogenase (acetylating)/methylmalonate-semialdehyde dehydrogenase